MKSEAARALDLTGRKWFWPSRVLAGSLKPKACVSMGAECQKQAEVKHALWGTVSRKNRLPQRAEGKSITELAADAPIDEIRP
jgi:hypothetical protein